MGHKRFDIFVRTAPGAGDWGSNYKREVSRALQSQYKEMVSRLEANGHYVLVTTSANVGMFVYSTDQAQSAP